MQDSSSKHQKRKQKTKHRNKFFDDIDQKAGAILCRLFILTKAFPYAKNKFLPLSDKITSWQN